MRNDHQRWTRRVRLGALGVLSLLVFVGGAVMAYAKGGTAKPPTNGVVAPNPVPTLPDPTDLTVPAINIHGFDETGFIQDATVDSTMCPTLDAAHQGGSVTINGVKITIPCNLIVQMPANTLTWADMVTGGPSLALKDGAFPSFELRVVGNIVGSKHIAGLAFASQQSANSGSGIIKGIDYSTGRMTVETGDTTTTTLEINDPNGRFGRKQSPDARFSVDDQNPTIHAGTGYPMCVPRSDPNGATPDALCPESNRPQPAGLGRHCRNWTDSGLVPLPASGDITQPPAGQAYCSEFVMPSVAGRAATDPDPRQQAPFEVGDHITWSGTLMKDSSGATYISAHTIEANLGIYTQPGTQPAYTAIGEFGVGTADPNAIALNGFAQETQDRIFLEAETTDVKTPVDIYMQDINPDGTVKNRWVTPFEMTGENQLGNPSGGITTQFAGAQPQRARLRATKAPLGLLSQPSRTIRVAQRTLCQPTSDATGNIDQAALDACLNNAPQYANGLMAGEYTAPTFEFIFPENVMPGDPVVPYDLWHLPFLRNGEGATGPGALQPHPW